MKAYMAYNRVAGQNEGAVLIFANNIKEAKKLAWRSSIGFEMTNRYIDVVVEIIRNEDYLFKQMVKNTPHCVEEPLSCVRCNMWGTGDISEDGICSSCKEDIDFEKRLGK